MDTQRNEARDAAMIGAFFLGYAALVWYAARRQTAAQTHAFNWGRIVEALGNLFRAAREPVTPGMEFARSIRDDLIAEENRNAD